MLTKHVHLHLRLEAADEGEAGLGVGKVGDAGLEFEEPIDVGVDVARWPEIGKGGGRGSGRRRRRLCTGVKGYQ